MTRENIQLVMTDTGLLKEVMVRKPANGEVCTIDWINFTIHENTFLKVNNGLIADEQFINQASYDLEQIFGFGVTHHRDKGLNFYLDSWVLGDDFGFVCFGGQRNTMLVQLNGQGCASAHDGWEKRLFHYLTEKADRPVITRIDLAHDDFEGERLTVDWAEAQYLQGGYTPANGGTLPNVERIGNWHNPTGKGRTFTIGTRSNGKFSRCYEKGKKEGDKFSLWTRFEVEYKSKDRVIPFEILLSPSEYFVPAYPCIADFACVDTASKIEVKKKAATINFSDAIEITRRQFGKYIRVFCEVLGDEVALQKIKHEDKDAMPKRLKRITSGINTCETPVHKRPTRPSVDPLNNFDPFEIFPQSPQYYQSFN